MRKSLKQQAKETENKILENNKDFYNEIVNQYFPEQETKRKRKLVLQVSSIAVVCVLIIAGITALLFNVLKEDNVEYLLGNEIGVDSDINELQNAAPWFYINTDENICQVTRTYDSVSGDNLYFEVNIRNYTFAEEIKINLYINPKYISKKELPSNDIQEKEIKGITVRYNERISQNPGIYNFSYKANYKQGKSELYIDYKQKCIDENTHFFEFLEGIIIQE